VSHNPVFELKQLLCDDEWEIIERLRNGASRTVATFAHVSKKTQTAIESFDANFSVGKAFSLLKPSSE
jgi:hypothetical protein